MWSITNDATRFGFAPGDVITIYESMNNIQIHSAGKDPEAAKAYLIGFRNKRGTFSMLAYLHFAQSRSREIYAPEEPDFELDTYSIAEDEGVQFLESMGFMMNNLNYRMLTQDQQAELQKELPCFWTNLTDFSNFREERIKKSAGDHEVQEVAYRRPEGAQTRERTVSGIFRAASDTRPGSGLIKPGTGSHAAETPAVSETDSAKLARLLSSF
jgi:hypothetical protein